VHSGTTMTYLSERSMHEPTSGVGARQG